MSLLAGGTDTLGTGGLYGLRGSSVEKIDDLSTNSIAVAGDRLLRLLWSHPGEPANLLVYSCQGLDRHHVLEGLGDAHHVTFDGPDYLLVSTATNSLVWLSPDGARREWKAPGAGDAWHLNGAFLKNGSILVSAFGRFSNEQGWRANARNGTGIVFDLKSGRDILSGLACPHHPLWIDGAWMVCNSAAHEVLRIDEQGGVLHRLNVGGWTRGVAASGDCLFVGVSAPRHDPGTQISTSSIAVISRRTWEMLYRLPLPSLEIGGLAMVPDALVDAIRRASRAVADLELQMLPLAPLSGALLRLEPVEVPCVVRADSDFQCRVMFENRSPHRLQSISPNPVFFSYHWIVPRGGEVAVFDGVRTRLAPAVPSGSRVFQNVNVHAPRAAGRYLLQLTLVQERVRWFDEPPTRLSAEMNILVSNEA
jgi:acetolactate synthase I/II/III large subunit